MATRALADIALDLTPRPGGATVAKVLTRVYELCHELGDGNATCLALHNQLTQIFEHLEEIEASGGRPSEAIAPFAQTLEAYWRHLDAYNNLTSIERLLHQHKMQKAIDSIHAGVHQLLKMVGVATTTTIVDWKRTYESDARAQQQQLVAVIGNTSELLEELRGVREPHDMTILLKHALDKIKAGQSKLSVEAQAALQSAFHTLVACSATNTQVEPTPPWFVSEADVDFDEKPFARGSFATVHRGTLHDHSRVVIKMLLPGEGGLNATVQKGFVEEANLWYTMRHPNVIQLLGAYHVSSRPFLVCEEAAHGNMHDFLREAPTHRQLMWPLLYEAAQGLSYLHLNGIVHGAVRLSNILVTDDLKALLTDFGLSRVKNKAKGMSMTLRKDGNVVLGNGRWKAPEARTHNTQFELDVYGLGMSMLEAYTGEPPFAEVLSESDVKAKVLNGERPMRPAGTSDRAWQLILDMTTLAPSERISMKQVIDRLRELATNEPAPPMGVVVDAAVAPSHTTIAFADVPQLLAELQTGTGERRTDAAKRISVLTATHPEVAQHLLSSASTIRILVDELQDSADPLVKEHLALVLANLAQDARGAKLIGSRGGVAPLVDLLSATSEQLRGSGLRALTHALKDPMNAMMFVQANGVAGLSFHLSSSSQSTRVEVLKQLGAMVSSSTTVAKAAASNRGFLGACLRHLQSAHADEVDAAGCVLRELVRHDASAVRAIHRTGGFAAMLKPGAHHRNVYGVETVTGAIETLLRASVKSARPAVGTFVRLRRTLSCTDN